MVITTTNHVDLSRAARAQRAPTLEKKSASSAASPWPLPPPVAPASGRQRRRVLGARPDDLSSRGGGESTGRRWTWRSRRCARLGGAGRSGGVLGGGSGGGGGARSCWHGKAMRRRLGPDLGQAGGQDLFFGADVVGLGPLPSARRWFMRAAGSAWRLPAKLGLCGHGSGRLETGTGQGSRALSLEPFCLRARSSTVGSRGGCWRLIWWWSSERTMMSPRGG